MKEIKQQPPVEDEGILYASDVGRAAVSQCGADQGIFICGKTTGKPFRVYLRDGSLWRSTQMGSIPGSEVIATVNNAVRSGARVVICDLPTVQ